MTGLLWQRLPNSRKGKFLLFFFDENLVYVHSSTYRAFSHIHYKLFLFKCLYIFISSRIIWQNPILPIATAFVWFRPFVPVPLSRLCSFVVIVIFTSSLRKLWQQRRQKKMDSAAGSLALTLTYHVIRRYFVPSMMNSFRPSFQPLFPIPSLCTRICV